MEHSISIIELLQLTLYLGAIPFIAGTLLFIFLLRRLNIPRIKTTLYSLLRLFCSFCITLAIWAVWKWNIDIMFYFLFLPSCAAEIITCLSFYFCIKKQS